MRSKYEREIEEILDDLDKFVPEETPLNRARQPVTSAAQRFCRAVLARWRGIPLGHLALLGIAGLVFAYMLRGVAPLAARVLVMAALTALLLAFVVLIRGAQSLPDITWRGKPVLPELHRRRLRKLIRMWLGKPEED